MAGSNYRSRHQANHRKMHALLIDEMHPRTIVNEDYERALHSFNRRDISDDRGWSEDSIRTFGTCLSCLGEGAVENPRWVDGETPEEPEDIDCETCAGVGIVEIIDAPLPIDIEEPF